MRNRFGDRCGRQDCLMNLLDRTTHTRICKGLIIIDFGGDCGGEHCNFYKPKKKNEGK